jgi:hypothetical protein
MSKKGYTFKYDLSLPVPQMYDIVEAMRERLKENGREDALTGLCRHYQGWRAVHTFGKDKAPFSMGTPFRAHFLQEGGTFRLNILHTLTAFVDTFFITGKSWFLFSSSSSLIEIVFYLH